MGPCAASAQLSSISVHPLKSYTRACDYAQTPESVLKICKAEHKLLDGRQRKLWRGIGPPMMPFLSSKKACPHRGQVRMLTSSSEQRGLDSISEDIMQTGLGPQESILRETKKQQLGRRKALELAALVAMVGSGWVGVSPAQAYKPPPEGFRRYTDRLDGFTLLYPEFWVQVRGSGAEVQFRSPLNGDENLFVSVSSPSSSKYAGVKDLGTPQDSSESIKKQYIAEFMSTRLGVRRTAEVLSASSRDVEEGKPYYDIEMAVKSVSNTNQLAITPQERVPFVEWERRYVTVQAVENKRLYELRVQVPADIYEKERPVLQTIIDSFRTFPVESFEGGKPV